MLFARAAEGHRSALRFYLRAIDRNQKMRGLISFALTAGLMVNTTIASPHWHASALQNSTEVSQDDAEHPSIELMLTPVDWSRQANRNVRKEKFRVGERVLIQVSVVSTEPREASLTSTFQQHRPRLMKDGHLVPHRHGSPAWDQVDCILYRVVLAGIPAHQPTQLDSFKASDWYEQLEPGEYELTLWVRLLSCSGPLYKSHSVTFEVTK
jgi:hypothetical protein